MADSFSIILISGASRGFGLAAAAQLSRQYPHSSMHLMASSIGRLDVASKLLVSRGHKGSIFHHGVELSKLASGDTSQCSSLVQALSAADAQQKVLFVHSAAVLGPTGPVEKFGLSNIAEISQAVQVNVAGSLALTTLIASSLSQGLKNLYCVNVSSKAAVNPGAFDLFDIYSVTKSATHFMFGSLSSRGARVLQYCPGPMKTDMTAAQHSLEWPWVEPEDSARAMVALIKEDSYVNNACLDYLDDSLEKRFSSTKSLDSDPSTPPKSSDNIVSTFSPEKEVIAAAVSVPARRRKCLITRIEAFSSSHTLENCNWQECEAKNKETFGKCNNLHGHNYKVEFSFAGYIDQETGMVVNISDLKVILQAFLGRLDHSHLNDHEDIFKGAPTTAEVISQVLFEEVSSKVTANGLPTELVKVKVWETEKNIAEFPF